MGSKKKFSEKQQAREESKYVIGVGSMLATWGLGLILISMNVFASKALSALPMILVPLGVVAMVYALHSSSIEKREDSSQIFLIALSGVLISSQILSAYYFATISASVAFVCYMNRKSSVQLAPIGVSGFFVVALAPIDPSGASVFVYCMTSIVVLAIFSKEDRNVATSTIPIFAALTLAFRTREIEPWQQICIAVAFIFLLGHLIRRRASFHKTTTERRAALDSVVGLFSFSLLFTATGLIAHNKYAALAAGFLFASLLMRVLPAALNRFTGFPAAANPQHTLVIASLPKFSNALFGAASLSAAISISIWPFGDNSILATTIRIILLLILTSATWLTAKYFLASTVRDASKLFALYCTFLALSVYLSNDLNSASDSIFGLFSLLAYGTVAVCMALAGRDLHYGNGAAWQSIFSGRALVRLRGARSGAFEILSKAPFIGWIFTLIDKALLRLTDSFGDAKIWTISHYAICLSVLSGFFLTMSILDQLTASRFPVLASLVSVGSEPDKTVAFVAAISRILAVLLFSAALFLAGAHLREAYLRVLATAAGGLLLAALWFVSLVQDKSSGIVWYYPLAFCCSFAMFRMLWNHAKSKA